MCHLFIDTSAGIRYGHPSRVQAPSSPCYQRCLIKCDGWGLSRSIEMGSVKAPRHKIIRASSIGSQVQKHQTEWNAWVKRYRANVIYINMKRWFAFSRYLTEWRMLWLREDRIWHCRENPAGSLYFQQNATSVPMKLLLRQIVTATKKFNWGEPNFKYVKSTQIDLKKTQIFRLVKVSQEYLLV